MELGPQIELPQNKVPQPSDAQNIASIKIFLNENGIEYQEQDGIFNLKEQPVQIRYANSQALKIGYKKFGYEGTTTKYAFEISKKAEDAGVRVIWWRDFEIQDQRKNNVIQSYILSACNKIKNRVYARDCLIKPIPAPELRKFLEENCFYGYRSASLNLGLYLKKDVGELKKDTLVMMWSVGHAFFGKKLYDLEIIRAATLLHTQVVGGASKLFEAIKNMPVIKCGQKEIAWNSLCFYVDYCHGSGKSLPTIGFKLLKYSGGGFMNINLETGEAFQRKPMIHKKIMKFMSEGKIVSTPLAGVKTFIFCKDSDYSKFNMA